MLGTQPVAVPTLGVPERRARRRFYCTSLVLIHRDASNGGISFNISEDGMALSAAYVLSEDRSIDLRIQFSESAQWTDLTGQIAWRSASRKEVGICFMSLTDEARERIRLWLASEMSADEPQAETRAKRAETAETALERLKQFIFSHSPPSELPRQGLMPLLGLSEDACQRLRNWIFGEERVIEPDSDMSWDGQRGVGLGNACGEKRSNESPAEPELVRERRTQNAGIFMNLTGHEARGIDNQLCILSQASPRESGTLRDAPEQPSQTVAKLACAANPVSVSERRSHARALILSLGYIQLGETNGGIALNISEGGLALSAARILAVDHVPSVRIQFPDSSSWVQTSARVVWRSASKKEVGLRFLGATEEVQRQIKVWISEQAAAISEPASPL